MRRVFRHHPRRIAAAAAFVVGIGLFGMASIAIYAQNQFALYVFAVDQQGVPVLDLKPSDITVTEEAGQSTVVSVRRAGWPLKVTVLVDNGFRTADSLVHYRAGLKKFFDGLPGDVPVSLIATAPNPRWLFRDTTDKVQIAKGVNLITPDDHLGRFSDSLIEYANRLDEEFRSVPAEQLPPYLPVLVSIATTHQDGSQVTRDANLKMITSLRKHRTWTQMIMLSPARAFNDTGTATVEPDEGQNAEIAMAVHKFTRGGYIPVAGAATSALSSKLLPDMAHEIAMRYVRQMAQHRVVLERPARAIGPMKDFAFGFVNRPGLQVIVSTDGDMP